MIVDAWAQRHVRDPIFKPLRRRNREEVPVVTTIRTMDKASIAKTLISAWVAPRNVMISNDEIAGFAAEHPDRLVGIGSVDISNPMQAIAEIRRRVEELSFRGSVYCLGCKRFRGRTAGLRVPTCCAGVANDVLRRGRPARLLSRNQFYPARPAAAGVMQRKEAKVFGESH